MNLRRQVTRRVYAGQMIECSSNEYPIVRQTLLNIMSGDGRLEAVTQVAACELQRLDVVFNKELD